MLEHKDFKFISDFQKQILTTKYCHEKEDGSRESFLQAIKRVAYETNKYDTKKQQEMTEKTERYIIAGEFSFAGGPWRAAGHKSNKVSAVNCTTQAPVKDSIEDIWESIKWWSRIASYGQGSGIDMSGLRPRGTPTNNCAKSSTGAVSFLEPFDSSMKVIGAENRRGATKPDIWIYHPDSEEYTTCKADTSKLTSQNISIKVDSSFMEAVEADRLIEQKWERMDDKVYVGSRVYDNNSKGPNLKFSKTIKASDLFHKIALAAWSTGEPGLEFWDTSELYSNSNYHPDSQYHIVSTNGCSEQKLDPYNTCILASLNFGKMPTIQELRNTNYMWLRERTSFGIRALDNVVEMEYNEDRSPHPEQRRKLKDMTRIGLGFTGLADWFIKNKVKYGSAESRSLTDELMAIFAEESYRTSIELGKERGSFKEFSPEWYTKSLFIQRLCKLTNLKLSDFTHMRHVCLLSVAPTGTLSYIVGAGGSGCEPIFAPWMYRSERATTGEYKEHYIFNDCIINNLTEQGLEINKQNAEKLIEGEEWVFANFGEKSINSIDKVDLMSVFYKYIDSGVSVTYNLPQSATVQDVKDIYLKAWKAGLKSVTVYRDKSREGILNLDTRQGAKIVKRDAVKRPKELPCNIHRLKVQGERWVVIIGLLGEDPYEVFAGLEGSVDLSEKDGKCGVIIKNKRGDYTVKVGDEEFQIKSFGNKPAESALTRAHSLNLRHGVDIKFIVDQLEKAEGDLTCFSKAIARVLKKYIPDGSKVSGGECGQCGSSNLVRQSGCLTCLSCLWSRC